MRRNGLFTLTPLLAVMLATALATAPAARAEPPAMPGMGMPGMGMHGGMGGMGMRGDQGMRHGGKEGHRFGPHNAAVHFIGMADMLGLDAGQVQKLQDMRDAWIEANSTKEARLKAAEADVKGLLSADDIDMKAVDAKLTLIGQLEGPLWHDFARQLADIKGLLTDDQKAKLRQHHRHHGM